MKPKQNSIRRDFIKKTTLGASAIVSPISFDIFNKNQDDDSHEKGDLHLNMTGYDYSRVMPFYDKKVTLEGCTYDMIKSFKIIAMHPNMAQ